MDDPNHFHGTACSFIDLTDSSRFLVATVPKRTFCTWDANFGMEYHLVESYWLGTFCT